MKILIPLDGSKFAEEILGPVVSLVEASRAEVHLIEVVKPSEAGAGWTKSPVSAPGMVTGVGSRGGGGVAAETSVLAGERTGREAEDYLNGIAARFFPRGAATHVVAGESPAAEIKDYALSEEVNLIAIATHGRTGKARVAMGSVAGELLKARVAPVFMVRPDNL